MNFGVNEIKVFNRKLRKQLKVFDHAFLLEVYSERDQFTRHSLHLNSNGKDQSAKQIVNTVKGILKEKRLTQSLWSGGACDGQGEESYPLAYKNQLCKEIIDTRKDKILDSSEGF